MKLEPDQLDRFTNLIGAPEFIHPWIDRFYEPTEIRLVLLLASSPLTADVICDRLNQVVSEKKVVKPYVERAFKRGVINRLQDGRFEMAELHTRFDIWAMFEGWMDIPEAVRDRLNAWEFAYYSHIQKDLLAALQHNRRPDPTRACPEYLLLHEAEALLERVERIYLWPCNCRSMMERCNRPVNTCLRFENDRDLGWEISRSRARKIVRDANRRGLMQSGEVVMRSDGTIKGGICNCCADCCFPHLMASAEKAEKLWPRSRYVAGHLPERCSACGLCIRRCPFEAFDSKNRPVNKAIEPSKTGTETDLSDADKKKGKHKKEIMYDPRRCRGCGVCCTGCPEKAIEMLSVDI